MILIVYLINVSALQYIQSLLLLVSNNRSYNWGLSCHRLSVNLGAQSLSDVKKKGF